MAQPFMTVASESDEEVHYSHPGWSWGGFMFNIFFAACLKRYWFLLWFGALLVPIVNLFVPFVLLGLMIYFGVKGRELAARSAVFTSKQQYIGFMKGIDHAGKCMFFLSLAGLLVMVAAVLTIFFAVVANGIGSSREAAQKASATARARSLVPVLAICRDAGGSVEAYSPQPGDVVCSDTSVIEDTYMVLPEGWRYGPVMDDELRMFVFSVTDSKTVIECDMNGCGEVTMYSE